MNHTKLTRTLLLGCLLILSIALSSCVPDEDEIDDDVRAPVVFQLA